MLSLKVGLAVSLLEGEAEDWWVHDRDQYWYTPAELGPNPTAEEHADHEAGPRYRYPRWEDFKEIFREQFRDPAIELVHEKRMSETKMGSDPAHVFFRKLEREAKLVNCLHDQTDHGLLVQALQRGIPPGYGMAIANLGIAIPRNYMEWKDRVLVMYEQRQRQKVFEQTQGIERYPEKKSQTGTKAVNAKPAEPSKPKGATDMKPRDAAGHWVTHKGQGLPMEIDAKKAKQRAEGRCFCCDEKGHLSRDCPHKGEKREVRALEAVPEPLAETTEVKEVKE